MVEKVYGRAEDKNVRAFVVYGKTADSKLYKEAAFTNQLTQAELENAIKKNMLIIKVGTELYTPAYVSGNKVNVVVKNGLYSEAFDATKTYALGTFCTKDSKIYECTTAISVAAAWDSSKWTEITSVDFKEWLAKAAE